MNKTRLSVSTFGTILGIAGIEHGVGEILQGNIKPGSMFFESWPDNPLYEIVAGEPAFTLFSNLPLFITGILAVTISLILIVWSIFFIQKKIGGFVFIGLAVCQFLFGAGVAGPVLIGIIIGLAATKINSDFPWMKKHEAFRNKIALIWRYVYILSILSWFAMWPGLVLLGMFIPLTAVDGLIVLVLTSISFTTLILTLISAFANDSLNMT